MMSCEWFVKLRTFISTVRHVCADTWDGGKCLCGLVVNRGLSCFRAWVRGRKEWGV